MKRLIDTYLNSPSAYEGNWWGHIRNRSLHTLLGLVVGYAAFFWFSWLGWLAFLAIYVAVEANQFVRFGAELWDSIEDFADVLSGAMLALGWWPVVVIQALYFASSVVRRRV